MYLPPVNGVDDPAEILALVRSVSFGHLVTAGPTLQATALPFLFDDGLTEVRGHVARANPQRRPDRPDAGGDVATNALLIVPGPDAYVSPRWYPSKAEDHRVVPTWNYELVHLSGPVEWVEDRTWIREVVDELTDRHETATSAFDGGPSWSTGDAPPEFVDRMIGAVVGVRLTVERVEAKRKLSQNRPEADRAGVRAGLAASPRAADRAVAAAMAAADEAGRTAI